MAKRGRISMASLMTPNKAAVIQRPPEPYELDDEESAEWRAIVASMPADHFPRSTFPMLVQLCRHVVASNRLKQLEMKMLKPGKGNKFDPRAFAELRKAMSLESSQIARLSRSMRLTQQSYIKSETLGRKLASPMMEAPPWANEEDETA